MTKWLVIVLTVVLIGGGVWWFTGSDDSETEDNTTNETTELAEGANEAADDETVSTTTISYTDDGFVPSTVGPLPVGTTITFVNNSSTDNFEPASDPHPVHTDLSGFDSIDPVPVGESYSFTFDEPGEWGFHNHLNSSETGTIIIE